MKKDKKKYSLQINKLTDFKKDVVERAAISSGRKIKNIKELNSFYINNKTTFDDYFSGKLNTIPKSASVILKQIDIANNSGYSFYIEKDGKLNEVTSNRLKYEIALTELWLNRTFEATGSEFSYTIKNDGTIIFRLPEREQEPDYIEEDTEIIVDYLSSDFGINVYISEPNNKKEAAKNKLYQDDYKEKAMRRKRGAYYNVRDERKRKIKKQGSNKRNRNKK
jgi:hypothetical protein